jgi:predicted permease
MLTRLVAYARGLLARGRVSRELQDELRFHLDQEIEANRSRGLSLAEARRRALADLGGLTQTAESVRAIRSMGLSRVQMDLRDALRGLRGGRGTTVLAFIILTLTMAAGTVTFSVVDAVALRPLPYGSPERLISISSPGASPGQLFPPGPRDYFSWLESARTLESLGAARLADSLHLQVDGMTETVSAKEVTANLFGVLGVRPAAGRFFGPEDQRPGGPAKVILSHALWVHRFGSDPGVIGRPLTIDQGTREVVGVMPEGVWYPITGIPPDVYIPYAPTAAERSNSLCCMFVVGRLRPGVSVEQARADVNRVSGAVVLPLQDQVVGPAKTWLLLLLAAVGFVLLVACVNVANLLLARATSRARELATREALGASRRRLAVGLLLEGLILALASAAAAIVTSFWGVEIAKASLPPGLTRVSTISVDGRVMAASIAAAVVCGLVFASAPAWLATRSDLVGVMKASGGSVIGGRRRDRSLSAFLVADVAFVCVLLVATTLVVTSFVMVTTADLGFDRHNVMTIEYRRALTALAAADRPAAAASLRADLVERARSVPGVTAAAISGVAPLAGGPARYRLTIPGFGDTKRDDMLDTQPVSLEYFSVMGIQLLRGRMFQLSEGTSAPRVILINEVAARRFFADRDPVGQVVTLRGPTTIIGVVRGIHFMGPEAAMRPAMYMPADQDAQSFLLRPPFTDGNLVVRINRDPRMLAAAVREAIRPALGGEPNQPQFVDDDFRRLTAGRRFNAGLMTTFGLIAVAIGAIGVYGTTAFFVARQVRAIGLRMALGASPRDVMRSVLRDALRLVVLGVGVGLAGAWAVSNAFTSFVFGVRPADPMVYLAVGGFIAVVGFAAALVPALRAARLDPLTALRQE